MQTSQVINNTSSYLAGIGWRQVHEVKYGKIFSLNGETIVVPKNNDAIVLYMHEYRDDGESNLEPTRQQAGVKVDKIYPADRSIKPRGHVLRALIKKQRILKVDFESHAAFQGFIKTVSKN